VPEEKNLTPARFITATKPEPTPGSGRQELNDKSARVEDAPRSAEARPAASTLSKSCVSERAKKKRRKHVRIYCARAIRTVFVWTLVKEKSRVTAILNRRKGMSLGQARTSKCCGARCPWCNYRRTRKRGNASGQHDESAEIVAVRRRSPAGEKACRSATWGSENAYGSSGQQRHCSSWVIGMNCLGVVDRGEHEVATFRRTARRGMGSSNG